jgi:hypothetical protein
MLALFLTAAQPAGAFVVGEQQPVVDSGAVPLPIGGAEDREVAQVATGATTAFLTEVQVPVFCSSGDLVLEIQGVADNRPNGTVIAAEFMAGAGLPSSGTTPARFEGIPLGPSPLLSAGERFALVLRSAGTCGVAQGPRGDPYPGGDAWVRSGSAQWVPLGGRADLPFQTVVQADPFGIGNQVSVVARCFLDVLWPAGLLPRR